MTTKPLAEMTDEELSACFAVEVAGTWEFIAPYDDHRYGMATFTARHRSTGDTTSCWCGPHATMVMRELNGKIVPPFATSVDALLPYCRGKGVFLGPACVDGKEVWEVQINQDAGPVHCDPYFAHESLPRALCTALILAKRDEGGKKV